jgi:hypothetical protein
MGQAERDFHDRTSRTSTRTELPVQGCQDRAARIGLPAQDCKDKTTGAEQKGEDSQKRKGM